MSSSPDFELIPYAFDDAVRLYRLRESDRATWNERTWIRRASWLIHILSARLRESEEHSAEIVRIARTRAEDLTGADCLIDSMAIREGFDYQQYARVIAEKQRLRDGVDDN